MSTKAESERKLQDIMRIKNKSSNSDFSGGIMKIQ